MTARNAQGVEWTSVRTLLPSGSDITISSAGTCSPLLSCCAIGSSAKDASRPSARRQVITSRSCSGVRTGVRRPSAVRRISRLTDTGCPLRASRTTTPTGEVSTRAPRRARGGGLGGEQHQDLLVPGGELQAAFLLAGEEVANVDVLAPHRRPVQRPARHQVGGEAECADVGGQVGQPDRSGQLAEVPEQPRPGGPPRRA